MIGKSRHARQTTLRRVRLRIAEESRFINGLPPSELAAKNVSQGSRAALQHATSREDSLSGVLGIMRFLPVKLTRQASEILIRHVEYVGCRHRRRRDGLYKAVSLGVFGEIDRRAGGSLLDVLNRQRNLRFRRRLSRDNAMR